MAQSIYLDHAATTPMEPDVREAMEPFLGLDAFGNPSSQHQHGQRARRALDQARDTFASLLDCESSEITFTSGGTEADNMALFGVMHGNRARGNHLITTLIEHHAVLNTAKFLEDLGFAVTYIAPNEEGLIDPADIVAAITTSTTLISVMTANNETGAIQPVREIGALARERGVLFHTDAVQAFGQIPVSPEAFNADLLSLSAHKIYGPKAVGALYVRSGVSIELLHGGGQERDRRSGTENVAGIVGFAKAAEIAIEGLVRNSSRIAELRTALWNKLVETVPGVLLNGPQSGRLPNNLNVSFDGFDAEAILLSLDLRRISASSGSACSSGSIEPSHVLTAMGLPESRVLSGAIRFSLGRDTTQEEIERTVSVVAAITKRMRES